MGVLSDPQRRGFNTLAILLSSLLSLALGSLFGILGSVIRWPLLAKKANKPLDVKSPNREEFELSNLVLQVDLILGMANPTGSFKLVWKHFIHWNLSGTTAVVALYLFANIASRLSVAGFGLTFSINEIAGVEFPVMVPDWGSDEWLGETDVKIPLSTSVHTSFPNGQANRTQRTHE